VLEPEAVISGTVKGADGTPMAGVRVELENPYEWTDAEADQDGRYRFSGLADGRYQLSVADDGKRARDTVDVVAGEIRDRDLTIDETRGATVNVRLSIDGTAIAREDVLCEFRTDEEPGRTADDGLLRLNLNCWPTDFVGLRSSSRLTTPMFALTRARRRESSETELIQLSRKRILVKAATGPLPAGQSIRLFIRRWPGDEEFTVLRKMIKQRASQLELDFMIGGLPAHAALLVAATGFLETVVSDETALLRRAGHLAGTVTMGGEPVPFVPVIFPSGSVLTDDLGRFRVARVAHGACPVSVVSPFASATASVVVAQETVELALGMKSAAGNRSIGHVRDSRGKHVAGAWISACPPSGGWAVVTASNTKGEFALDVPYRGGWVIAFKPGYAVAILRSGDRLAFTLERESTVRFVEPPAGLWANPRFLVLGMTLPFHRAPLLCYDGVRRTVDVKRVPTGAIEVQLGSQTKFIHIAPRTVYALDLPK
jgi:hypothetical protein